MGLLDRFRTQPEWKHEDPAVRATAVRDLTEGEQELFLAIATEDADPGVRVLAVGRLTDPGSLGRIARDDPDEGVRTEAVATLRLLAAVSADASVAVAAVAALTQERDLTVVGRTAVAEAAARAALGRLNDQKAIASVARRTPHVAVGLEALARLTDPTEVFNVVTRAEEKTIVLAGFDRLGAESPDNRELLASVARRAKSKVAVRRARSLLRAMDQAAGLPVPAPEDPAELCRAIEALAAADAIESVGQPLADLVERWEQLLETGEGVAEGSRARFAGARRTIDDRLAALAATRAREAEAAETRVRAVEARRQLYAAIDAVAGDDEPRFVELRAQWAALEPMEPGADLTAVERGFERACRAWETRRQAWQSAGARAEKLAEVLTAMEQLITQGPLDRVRERWRGLHKEWLALTGAGPVPDEAALQQRFAAIDARRRALEAEARSARERHQAENLTRLQGVCDAAEVVAATPALELRDTERTVRVIRAALGHLGPLPSKRDRDEIGRRLKAVHAAVLGRARELRDFADWQRWANLGVQEELCQRLEALVGVEDVPLVARELRDIMTRWRQAADAPREESAALAERFKRAYDLVHPRCAAYFAAQAAEREANLARKIALCEEAERLSTSTDWIRTAQRITQLQAEWKASGPVARQQQRELWNRFRAACGQFFQRRKADLVVRKKEWAANLERKEALCASVEALAETTDWDAAVAEVKRLQLEWKTIGPVRRSRSDAVWQRFRAACDRFFQRYQERDQRELAERSAMREALCQELELLLPPTNGERPPAPADLAERVRDIRARWRQAPELPRDRGRHVISRFNSALARLLERHGDTFRGSDLDPRRNLKRLEQLCERVESLLPAGADDRPASPAEILARRWREALAANTMGVRVDEEARRRAAIEDVRRAQAERRRIGPVPGEPGRVLAQRFQRACDRFFQQLPNN